MGDIRKDLEEARAYIATMNEQLGMLESMTNTYIRDMLGLSLDCKDKIKALSHDDEKDPEFEELTERDIADFFSSDDMKKLEEGWETEKKNYPELVSYKRSIVKKIRSSIMDAEKLRKDKEGIEKNVDEINQNYFNYVNSDEYKQKKLQRIAKMRKQAEEETDPVLKKKILDKLDAVEKSENLMFLYDLIHENGEKELGNIVDIFFNNERSRLVMKKFETRLPKYGYKPQIYKMYFNLEENFLPEKYHVFNNFFLFHVMRYISFTNTDSQADTLHVAAILLSLYNLNYHKFSSPEQEKKFLSFIQEFLDQFEKYRERFEKENILAPGHPYRIAKDKEYDQKRRIMIIAKLQDYGVEPDTTLETEDLRRQLQAIIDKENGKAAEEPDTEEKKEEEAPEEIPTEEVEEESREDEEPGEVDEDDEEDNGLASEGFEVDTPEEIAGAMVDLSALIANDVKDILNGYQSIHFLGDKLPKVSEIPESLRANLFCISTSDLTEEERVGEEGKTVISLAKFYKIEDDEFKFVTEIPTYEEDMVTIEANQEVIEKFDKELEQLSEDFHESIPELNGEEIINKEELETGVTHNITTSKEEVDKVKDDMKEVEDLLDTLHKNQELQELKDLEEHEEKVSQELHDALPDINYPKEDVEAEPEVEEETPEETPTEEVIEEESREDEEPGEVDEEEEEDPFKVSEVSLEENPEKKEIVHYLDRYNCYYKMIGKTYSYYDEDGNLLEENIPEEDILMLNSSGALRKETVIE